MHRLAWFGLIAILGNGCGAEGSIGSSADGAPGTSDAGSGGPDADSVPTPDARPQVTGLGIEDLDRYIVLGDSLSVYTYPNLLFADLQQAFPGVERVHRGESGSEITDVIDHQIPGLQPHAGPVLVTLTIGGNDFKRNPSAVMSEALSRPMADDFEADLETAVQLLEAKFTGDLWILIANIHDPSDAEGTIYERSGLDGDVCDLLFLIADLGQSGTAMSNLDYWNGRHAAVADRKDSAYLADLHQLYLGHAMNAGVSTIAHYHPEDPTRWLLTDCAHPTPRGDEEIADMFWRMIE